MRYCLFCICILVTCRLFGAIEDSLIHFQVNTDIRYVSTDDFRTSVGKSYFLKASKLEQRLIELKADTDSLRTQWNKDTSLTSRILANENQEALIYEELATMIVRTREAEAYAWSRSSTEEVKQWKSYIEEVVTRSEKPLQVTPDPLPERIIWGEESSPDTVFMIKIMEYHYALSSGMQSRLDGFSVLYTVKTHKHKNLTFHTIGNYRTLQQAESHAKRLLKEGAKQAEVVLFVNDKYQPPKRKRKE